MAVASACKVVLNLTVACQVQVPVHAVAPSRCLVFPPARILHPLRRGFLPAPKSPIAALLPPWTPLRSPNFSPGACRGAAGPFPPPGGPLARVTVPLRAPTSGTAAVADVSPLPQDRAGVDGLAGVALCLEVTTVVVRLADSSKTVRPLFLLLLVLHYKGATCQPLRTPSLLLRFRGVRSSLVPTRVSCREVGSPSDRNGCNSSRSAALPHPGVGDETLARCD